MATFGEKFKELRKAKGYTQQQLADVFFLNKSSISRYEKNLQTPEASLLLKFAEFFGVSLDYLMGQNSDADTKDEIIHEVIIPKEYTDKYKVTSIDTKQYMEEVRKLNEAFFMNDDFSEVAKKEMLDAVAEMFWMGKAMRKRKK
jgi:transcriptional regulator with XRE-family HTH domain